jgi:hypothetical protein
MKWRGKRSFFLIAVDTTDKENRCACPRTGSDLIHLGYGALKWRWKMEMEKKKGRRFKA